MKIDPESNPIAFEIAQRAFTATVVIEATDTGARVPTITLSSTPGTPARTLNAACHYLALLAELGSGPSERWAIGIEIDHADLALVFIETEGHTDDEVARAASMLEDVIVAAQLSRPVPLPTN